MGIRLKRVYEVPSPDDGRRVLVDRLWPRGVKKESLVLDEWAKEAAPSPRLRTAWHSGGIDDAAFRAEYAAELDGNPEVARLADFAREGTLTLLFAARDVQRTHARILADAIEAELRR